MDQNLKYFIYVRKSSEGKDRQVLSHEGQLMEIEKIIERENLTIVDTYKESKSAHVPDKRPLFNQILKRIRRGEANGIILWHTNRLCRNPKEAGIIQQMLQDGIIQSIIVPHRHFRSADNALLFSIETSEANQYSRDLKKAVKRGLEQKYLMGQPPGLAPLGYLNTKFAIRGSNKIIVDNDRWSIVRKGFDMLLAQTHSVPQILDILTKNYGLRTRSGNVRGGRLLSRSGIYRMVTDPFYCGLFSRGGTIYKGAYKPMITIEEFDSVQIILGRKGKPRAKHHTFAYTGLMHCGQCGSAITACEKQKHLKSGVIRTYRLYHCTRRKKGAGTCTERKYISESILEEFIVDELTKYQLHPKFKELGIQLTKEHYDKEIVKYQDLIEAEITHEKRLKDELSNLVDLRISNSIPQEMYLQKKYEKEELLIRVQSKIENIPIKGKNLINEIERYLNFTTDLILRFEKGDKTTKKEICHEFGWNWTLQNQKLLIDKPKWLEAIKNYKNGVEAIFNQSEPEKSIVKTNYNSISGLVYPLMCALVDEVSTKNSRTDSGISSP